MMGQEGPKHVGVCVLEHYCNSKEVRAFVGHSVTGEWYVNITRTAWPAIVTCGMNTILVPRKPRMTERVYLIINIIILFCQKIMQMRIKLTKSFLNN